MKTVAVIGLGLIGGSILKGLQGKDYKLIGVARRQETVDEALGEGIISEGSTELNIIKDADVIFVCTPINKTLAMIYEAAKVSKPEAVITDVAGIKAPIMANINLSAEPVRFIGGHPMAGTENKGLEASFAELFNSAKWVLTPSKWSDEVDEKILKSIIEELGAEVIVADPDEHDKAVALISHMPLFLSQALFSLVKNYPEKSTGELAMKLAASGFRDMTRLAATNVELAKDMLFENYPEVLMGLTEFISETTDLTADLGENREKFCERIEELARARKQMYSPEGKNVYSKE